MLSPREYYQNENVRRNIENSLQGANYFAVYGENFLNATSKDHSSIHLNAENLETYGYSLGSDIFRALQDERHGLFCLDVEYKCDSHPYNILIHPENIFNSMEYFYYRIINVFRHFDIAPLIVMTGKGYHFLFKINKFSHIYNQILQVGHVNDELNYLYSNPEQGSRRREPTPPEDMLFWNASGKLMEYFILKVMESFDLSAPFEAVLADVAPVLSEIGLREGLSIDNTQYAFPQFMRSIRVPFSVNQKLKLNYYTPEYVHLKNSPIPITLPRHLGKEIVSLEELFHLRKHFYHATQYATEVDIHWPIEDQGTENLFNSYINSNVYHFHNALENNKFDAREDWPRTYHAMDISQFPSCAQKALEYPEPFLKTPVYIKLISEYLYKSGWEASHIVGFILSKYEHSIDLGRKMDAQQYVEWWVRTYLSPYAHGILNKDNICCEQYKARGICQLRNKTCSNSNF